MSVPEVWVHGDYFLPLPQKKLSSLLDFHSSAFFSLFISAALFPSLTLDGEIIFTNDLFFLYFLVLVSSRTLSYNCRTIENMSRMSHTHEMGAALHP